MVKPASKGPDITHLPREYHEFGIVRKRIADKQVARAAKPIQVNNVPPFSQLIPRRLNMFDANHAAPYSRRIKILDRHFRAQSESKSPADDVIFHGYLP
jgi:hypothetical protein